MTTTFSHPDRTIASGAGVTAVIDVVTAPARPDTSRPETHWETSMFAAPQSRVTSVGGAGGADADTVDDLLGEARSRYERISVRAAYQWALHRRAVIVDIRPQAQREAEGEVHPGLDPVVVERNDLEWRLDPRSDARLRWVTPETRVIVLCQEGYASSLAAASLARLGLRHVTDAVGGLRAWREAGLPLA